MDKVQELTRLIKNSRNTVFLGGAGVSTESGLPDFRSDTGLYSAERVYGYPPEVILSHSFFEAHPDIFFRYYRENRFARAYTPNAAHIALAEFERAGKLQAVITQNTDGLHQAAGSKNVLELHGSIHRHHCVDCGEKYTLDYVVSQTGIPRCGKCGGIVRPDVVLYGESLDKIVLDAAVKAVSNAELLIIGGTSLEVYPASGLLWNFRGSAIVLINKTEIPGKHADIVFREPIGEVLGAVRPKVF